MDIIFIRQLANIHWNHQNSQSVIKVEVWDVVDKGKPRSSASKGLKFFNKLTKGQHVINIGGQAVSYYFLKFSCYITY